MRWTLKVSPDTDEAVRAYLGRRGRSARALSRLVEDALRAQVFEKSVERVKGMTAGVGAAKLRGLVRQAVRHARRHVR
ncbi:MAG: ribbon-helix-helix domain-containing protein [Geminicoccales bacterium]